MKNKFVHFVTLMMLLFVAFEAAETGSDQEQVGAEKAGSVLSQTTVLEGPSPSDAGGQRFLVEPTDDISPAVRKKVLDRARANIEELRSQGKIPVFAAQELVEFGWPLKNYVPDLNERSYFRTTNFVDHDPDTGQLLDYNGGTRTYDLMSGYDHRGTDIALFPFPWLKMSEKRVAVVAAAAGTIADIVTNMTNDKSCSMNNNTPNSVSILHLDGSIGMYFHFKANSLTNKVKGDTVVKGEFLGYVGSSGSSTIPHVHFELVDASGNLIDPYFGGSNPTVDESLWDNQRPYYDTAVVKMTTGLKAPEIPACPNVEKPNSRRVFKPYETIYFTAYIRDQRAGQISTHKIIRPDASTYTSWYHVPPAYSNGAYWYWIYNIGAAKKGTWNWQVTLNGVPHRQSFEICDTAPSLSTLSAPANAAQVTKTQILLDWSTAKCTDEYYVYVRETSTTGPLVYFGKTTASSITVRGLKPGKYYWWYVGAKSTLGYTKTTYNFFKVTSSAQ